MATDQISLFALFLVLFGLLIWGRIRYDLVAFAALLVAVAAGLIAPYDAFHGFGHPAVVIIALVLIVSRALMNSGAVELIAKAISAPNRTLPPHIAIMAVVGAALSAVINNVAALALLMTLDIDAARKAKRAISLSLMPLSFATILGGMITLIGTPPNIVIAQYREDALGAPFGMFDFAPVGLVVSLVGIAYVALFGWRLIPARPDTAGTDDSDIYVAEAEITEGKAADGVLVSDLYPLANEHDITILGLVRNHRRLPGFSRQVETRAKDALILEGNPKQIEAFLGAAGLTTVLGDTHGGLLGKQMSLIEAIVPDTSRLVGRSTQTMRLPERQGVMLMGVSRQGERFRDRVRKLEIRAGDVLLLAGPDSRLETATTWLGVLPLANRKTDVIQRAKAFAAIAIFAAAIALSVMGLLPLAIGLGMAVVAYVAMGLVGGPDFYELIEWKVIVLLACLIPLGAALETSGATQLIAERLVAGTQGLPAWAILAVLMAITMTLSDFLNNVATALIAAPIGISVAQSLGANPDAFLMGVAVAASCAFLTPIGHKNNTIIMGPGNYHFGDYWRMGLILELIVLAVSVPAIAFFWPLFP
ncbi:MAG: SLC13 family permease [Rhodobacter sp.]|nr:SLC13 family permease [Rhodobacter sp.]